MSGLGLELLRKEATELLGAVAAFISALGVFLTGAGTLYNYVAIKRVKAEVTHNHGSSLKDAVDRIERRQSSLIEKTEGLTENVKSLGHQIGEIRETDNVTHTDITARLRALEGK